MLTLLFTILFPPHIIIIFFLFDPEKKNYHTVPRIADGTVARKSVSEVGQMKSPALVFKMRLRKRISLSECYLAQ